MSGWRYHLPVHPAAELFPLMKETDPEGFRELVEDIKKNGLAEPIIFCADPNLGRCVLDGRNRLDAIDLLGPMKVSCEELEKEKDPYAYVISKNIQRRHLTTEQKSDLIVKVLKAKPEVSNLQIAKQIKVDDKTVAKVRRKFRS